MKEIGVFCGTFNPIHWGHMLIAECSREQFDLTKVIFVTSANPPHRHTDLLDAEDRHLLVSQAVSGNLHFESSRMELDRPGPSYTVDTLRQLAAQDQDCHFNLILGEDNLFQISQWHESAELFKLARLLVAPRDIGGTNEKLLQAKQDLEGIAEVDFIDFPHIPVSSSLIRQRIREKKTILFLVPPVVDSIIKAKNLYQ